MRPKPGKEDSESVEHERSINFRIQLVTYYIFVCLIEVVVAAWQSQAALVQLDDVARAVALVGAHRPGEETASIVLVVVDLERALQVPGGYIEGTAHVPTSSLLIGAHDGHIEENRARKRIVVVKRTS